MKKFVRCAIMVMVLVPFIVSVVPAAPVSLTYTWTLPTTGSTCVSFDVQRSLDGSTWTDYSNTSSNSAVVLAPELVSVSVRVRGVDSLGRKGIWSDPSSPYVNDPGVPGACGKPSVVK